MVEKKDNAKKGLREFNFALFDYFEGVHMEVIEISPYLLMLIGYFTT